MLQKTDQLALFKPGAKGIVVASKNYPEYHNYPLGCPVTILAVVPSMLTHNIRIACVDASGFKQTLKHEHILVTTLPQ